MSRERTNLAKNLVGFSLGETTYALDIFRVREIMTPLPLTQIPKPPPSVVGVVDHRGEVLPVIDLRDRLGLPSSANPTRSKWIVVRGTTGVSSALIVDAVTEVLATAVSERRPVQVGQLTHGGVQEVYARSVGLVFVLDVDTIVEVGVNLALGGL